MKLESSVFNEGDAIPVLYTKEGDNISPPLQWKDVPEGTESFALTLQDVDAQTGIVTHWLLYNLPAIMRALDREVPEGGRYGSQAMQGLNDFGRMGYTGPVPTQNERRYIFRLYALDTLITLNEPADAPNFLETARPHILAQSELGCVYAKKKPGDVPSELRRARAQEDAYDLSVHRNRQQPEESVPEAEKQHAAL